MEVNLPFRLKEVYNNNPKTESNRTNVEKKNKNILKNIKNNWDNNDQVSKEVYSPLKNNNLNKKSLSILNNYYNYKNIKSLSIDNSDNIFQSKKANKKSLFEDEYFIEKLKKCQIPLSLNSNSIKIKNEEIKHKKKFYSKNVYFGSRKISNNNNYNSNGNNNSNKNEIEKTSALNLPKVRINNPISNPYIEEKNSFINLNLCFDSFKKQINKEAVDEYFNRNRRIIHNSPFKNIRSSRNKVEKSIKNNSYIENDAESLKKIIQIAPLITNSNGNLRERTNLCNSNRRKKEVNNSFSGEDQKVVLPNLIPQDQLYSIKERGNNMLRKTFNSHMSHNKIYSTDNNNASEIIKNKCRNFKFKRNDNNNQILNSVVSSNINFTKSQTQFCSPKSDKERNIYKKYKFEINNKASIIMNDIPPINYYSKNYYYYNIFPQNCGWLIKKSFAHRKKWKECHSNNTNLYNFKWKDVVTIKDYVDFGVSKKQMINHFDNHSALSNKYKMFYNFAKYCEINNIDVFKYVPFTIGFDYLNYKQLSIHQDNFKELFNNINNYIFENDSINNQLYDRRKIPYRQLFPLDDPKIGYKFYCEIPKSHYAGKNLWIVKAPNLNRGRCIKIFDNYNEIMKFLNEMKKGNVNQYDNIKEKGYKYEKIKEDKINKNNEIKKEIKEEIKEEKEEIIDEDKNNNKDKDDKNTLNIEEQKLKEEKSKTIEINRINKDKDIDKNNSDINNISKIEKSSNNNINNNNNDKNNDNCRNNSNDKNNKNDINNKVSEENKSKEKEKEKQDKDKDRFKIEKGDYQSDIIILQKYIERPFLYNGRKCDIRIWVLISHKMDVFIFKEGHLKASSVNYSVDNNNSFIHLTNYSLQKYNKNFSKYETGNEISFDIFQQYLDTLGEKTFNFREIMIPKFKKIIELTTKSSRNLLNLRKSNFCFEIFGYDFMMDEEKNVYLIEINTNPGLEISSEIIKILVPRMVEDALRITVDDVFETEYDKEWVDESGNYKSNYHVDGYDDKENMWELICNLNKSSDKFLSEEYYGFGYHKNSNKENKKNRKEITKFY